MANNNDTTLRFHADISDLKKGIKDANRQIRLANSTFQAAASGMDDWSSSAEGLTAKITQLTACQEAGQSILNNLRRQYELTAAEMGENSDEAQELLIRINQQQTTLNNVSTALQRYRSQLDAIENTTTQTVSAYDRLTAEINAQESELSQLRREYANYVVSGNTASDEAQQLQQRISTLSRELNENRQSLRDADSAADEFADGMNEIDAAADGAGDATESLAEGFTVVKGALADLVADGIRAAVDAFKELMVESDKAFNNFQAQTGTSAAAMADFEKEISDLYKSNFGENMQDVADAMAQVAQTSKETDPSKIKELTESALILRDTFDFEISETMRAVNMLMDQFGITGEQAFNLIAQGAQNGLNKNGDLLDSVNEYSVHYKQLGYTAEEFFNSLVNGTEAGTFSVDKLGDTVKEFGIRLKDNSDATADALAMIGLAGNYSKEAFKDAGKSLDKHTAAADKYTKRIEDLEKKLKYAKMEQAGFNEKTSELKKAKMADNIAAWTAEIEENKTALSEEQAVIESLKTQLASMGDGMGDLTSIVDRMNAGGESAREATEEVVTALMNMEDKTNQNVAGVALFGTMWEDLGAEGVAALMDVNGEADKTAATMEEINAVKYDDLGSAFSEIGRILKVDLLQPLVNELSPKIKEFIEWLKGDAVPWLIDNANNLVAAIVAIGAAFAGFKATVIIQGLISAFSMLIPMIRSVGVAQTALNLIMAANPVGLIVAAVSALVAAFIYLWNTSDEFRAFWINLWETLKTAISTAVSAIGDFFVGLWDGIKTGASAAWDAISGVYSTVATWFNDNIITPVSTFFGELWDSISTAAGDAWASIKEFFAPAVEWFTALFTSIRDYYESVIDVIIGIAKGCWEIIKRVYQVVSGWFKSTVIDPVSKWFTKMWDGISDAAKTAWDWIKGVFKTAATWFNTTIIKPVSGFFTDMWDGLKSGASAAWDGIKSVFGVVTDWFRDKFSEAWGAVKAVFSTGGQIFDGIKDGIVSAFKTVVNAIIRGINKIITIPFNSINSMLNKLHDIEILDIKPFAGLWSKNPLSVPQIPELAKGGVLKRGQVGLLEGDGAEAVVPLEKNTEWIKRVAAEMTKQFDTGSSNNLTNNNSTVNNYTFNQTNNSPKALNRLELYRQGKKQIDFIKAVTQGV